LERTFAIDVLACPECGGRLRLIATINDHAVIKKVLGHLGLPTEAPTPMPAQVAGSENFSARVGVGHLRTVRGATRVI
jgi:uncharacterized protein YbaR (Trm112 family)